jgi:hypothetical protein
MPKSKERLELERERREKERERNTKRRKTRYAAFMIDEESGKVEEKDDNWTSLGYR